MMPKWALALAIPVGCAIAFWIALPPRYRVSESTDYDTFYAPVAHRILAGQGITTPNGAAALRYPPGYPLIVATASGVGGAVGLSETAAMDIVMFMSIALSSLFLFLIASDVWRGWIALLPSVAWSTYPLALWLTKQPNSEVPFTALLFACALVLWKLTRSASPRPALVIVLGVLAGAAMLVRPIALLLPLALAVLLITLALEWPRRARMLAAGGVLLASAIVIAPWEIHASHAQGRIVLLSTGGVPSMRDGLTFGVNPDKSYRIGIYVPDAIRTVMIAFYAQYEQLDSYGAIAKAGTHQLAEHPAGTIGLVGMKLGRAWYGTDSQRLDGLIAILQAVYLTALVWASWFAWKRGGDRRRLVIIVGTILLYFWTMSVMALPLVRYMVPAIGMAFLLLPAALERRGA